MNLSLDLVESSFSILPGLVALSSHYKQEAGNLMIGFVPVSTPRSSGLLYSLGMSKQDTLCSSWVLNSQSSMRHL